MPGVKFDALALQTQPCKMGGMEGGFPLDLCSSLWVPELPSGQGGGRGTKDI